MSIEIEDCSAINEVSNEWYKLFFVIMLSVTVWSSNCYTDCRDVKRQTLKMNYNRQLFSLVAKPKGKLVKGQITIRLLLQQFLWEAAVSWQRYQCFTQTEVAMGESKILSVLLGREERRVRAVEPCSVSTHQTESTMRTSSVICTFWIGWLICITCCDCGCDIQVL